VINSRDECFEAEVVGFAGESLYLMPTGEIARARAGRARGADGAGRGGDRRRRAARAVIDGAGRPLAARARSTATSAARSAARLQSARAHADPRAARRRHSRQSTRSLSVGAGRTRLCLLRPARAVGKSVLLGMMTRYTNADVVVVA